MIGREKKKGIWKDTTPSIDPRALAKSEPCGILEIYYEDLTTEYVSR